MNWRGSKNNLIKADFKLFRLKPCIDTKSLSLKRTNCALWRINFAYRQELYNVHSTEGAVRVLDSDVQASVQTFKIYELQSQSKDAFDIVLSSGFLAFSSHAGFLQAVDDKELCVNGIMGTSAGALTGSLYAAGYTPEQVLEILCDKIPLSWLQGPSLRSGALGALNLGPVIERLGELLPATFEELPHDFACAVVTSDGFGHGSYRLIDSGPLAEAVAASAAIPFLFQPVRLPQAEGALCADGGKYDRVGLRAWRSRKRQKREDVIPVLAHVIARSSPFSGDDDVDALQQDEKDIIIIESPKSGMSLFSLGEYEAQAAITRERVSNSLIKLAKH
ncbi:hypothetical protein CYMTET_44955 [Cymbomonas tetramitiformis]|uniref:Patatin n=1 Tax=Cymbomonas tetramitiformis TaxID=36881 RepID=A0AAE0BZ68_9CHLO|nr:hypothetical protein CYMTET_44955 [Cymbomonas tetramitiformis]